MNTIKKIKNGFQEIFLIWFVVSLMATSSFAEPGYLSSSEDGFKPESAREVADSSFSLSLIDDPNKAFVRESFVRSFIDKSIFPGMNDLESSPVELLLRMRPTGPGFESINFNNSTSWNMSLTQERARRAAAIDQTYKIALNMFSSIKPVARLQKALEPYTRLIELYRDEDGAISSNYLGQTNNNATGSVRVFVINLGVSSSNNLNIMANIHERFTISLLNGDRLFTQYLIPEGLGAIGLETNTRSETLFRYSLEF